MTVTVRLNKAPLQIEWQLESYEQANKEVFDKICEEIVNINAYLKQLERERKHIAYRLTKYQAFRLRYGHTSIFWQNYALRYLRTLFEKERLVEAKT